MSKRRGGKQNKTKPINKNEGTVPIRFKSEMISKDRVSELRGHKRKLL